MQTVEQKTDDASPKELNRHTLGRNVSIGCLYDAIFDHLYDDSLFEVRENELISDEYESDGIQEIEIIGSLSYEMLQHVFKLENEQLVSLFK